MSFVGSRMKPKDEQRMNKLCLLELLQFLKVLKTSLDWIAIATAVDTQDTLHENLCNCPPCLGRDFGFASNCSFSSHICFISWKWLYLNYWLVCQYVISVDLSTKIKVGSGIPLDLSTKIRSRSMIPVDLSTKWQNWIYDLRGSRIKIQWSNLRKIQSAQIAQNVSI